MNLMKDLLDLRYISAPMVNQSDLPFRLLVHQYGASLTYTQMLNPTLLLDNKDYLDFHLRDLRMSKALGLPVVVQLCGNDTETIVKGARSVAGWCDGIDLNLGCPQEHARQGHYGAYLLGVKDWPLVQDIVSSLSHSLPIPVSAKLRLTTPPSLLVPLSQSLHHSGASWITLHARHVSARRRRHGLADLSHVRVLRDELPHSVKVVSNGNVRPLEVANGGDVRKNLNETGADGIMVGEALLANPCLFAHKIPDPVSISLSYLSLCRAHPNTVTLSTMQTHIRHFVEAQCGRGQWYAKFRAALGKTKDVEEVEKLLMGRLRRWMGLSPLKVDQGDVAELGVSADPDQGESESE